MKNFSLRGGIAIALGATLALSGCGSGDEPTDQQAEAASSSVDLASLDTGDFPTEPHGDFGNADESKLPEFEAQRLAEFTALPQEIDPMYDASEDSEFRILTSVDDGYGTDTQNELKTELGFDFGTVGSGYATAPDGEMPKDQLFYEISHFPDAESAAHVSAHLGQMEREGEPAEPGEEPSSITRTPMEIPGHPEAVATTVDSEFDAADGTLQVLSYSPRGEFVVRTSVTVPRENPDRAPEMVARTLDVQNPLLDQFVAAPGPGKSGEEPASAVSTTIDQGEVIRYAVPSDSDPVYAEGSELGEYGPRGYAQLSKGDRLAMFDVLNAAEVQHIGVWGSTVFRAGDEDKANRLVEDLVAHDLDAGWFEDEAQPGVPNARCMFEPSGADRDNRCYVVVGKYVGLVSGTAPTTEINQELAAQYAILTHADQDA